MVLGIIWWEGTETVKKRIEKNTVKKTEKEEHQKEVIEYDWKVAM